MALYHEQRPQSFSAVLGQEHIITTIKNQLTTGKTSHAYLFSGPRGVGKTTTARVLAKALNCKNRKTGEAEPCNICTSCQEITESRAIDVIEIDAASNTGVDNVRENIIENAQFRPTSSTYKIFIIDEVHMLSTSAFNALLKTLEEPPAHVVFILATTEMQKLPETIVSRCQRFQFKKIPFATLSEHLTSIAKEKKVKIDADVLDRVARKSDGGARDAVSLLDQMMATGEKHITAEIAAQVLPISRNEDVIKYIDLCLRKNVPEGLVLVSELFERGVHMSQFLADVVEILRAMLLKKAYSYSPATLDLTSELEIDLEKTTELATPAELLKLVELAIKRQREVRGSSIPTLPAELLLFEWSEAKSPATPAGRQEFEAKSDTINKSTDIEEKKTEEKMKVEAKIEINNEVSAIENSSSINLDTVKKIWPDFLLSVEKTSTSLVFILKMADIREVKGNTVVLAVQFGFHRDKLLNVTAHRQLEENLSKVIGSTAHLDAIVESKEEDNVELETQEVAMLLGSDLV